MGGIPGGALVGNKGTTRVTYGGLVIRSIASVRQGWGNGGRCHVVDDNVHHEIHSFGMEGGGEVLEILLRAKVRVECVEVQRPVSCDALVRRSRET
jgi:hypothetical protein